MPVNDNTMGRDPLRPMDLLETDATRQLFGGGSASANSGFSYPSGDVSNMPHQPPPGSPGATPAPVEFKADTNAALDALSGRYNKQLDNIEGNTGRIMDIAGSRYRDAREGGRRSLADSQTQAGVASSPATAQFESDTTRGVESAIADKAQEQQNAYTSALQGGVAVHSAAPELALREKQFQASALQSQQANNLATANSNWDRYMALLQAQRTSPATAVASPAYAAALPDSGKGAYQTAPVQYSR